MCFLFFFCAQSVRPRYQSMTSIAYLHDCHCCHNERSIVPKKKSVVGSPAGRPQAVRRGRTGELRPGRITMDLGGSRARQHPWRRSLWILEAAGRPCRRKTKRKEKTRKRRPGNRKTTREKAVQRGCGGMGGVVCMRVCGCTYMAEPHIALGGRQVHPYGEAACFFFLGWLMSLWLTRYKDYIPLGKVGI